MDQKIYEPSREFVEKANINREQYEKLYAESVENPEKFWAEQAERLTWYKKWDRVLSHNFTEGEVKWFEGGKLNVSYNCLDRHLDGPLKDKTAIIWEGDNPEVSKSFTYAELHKDVNRAANVLKKLGVKKGDRVIIYLPMIPELAVVSLACTRIGAIHSIVFGGFSPESLVDRIEDCKPSLIITSDAGRRGGRIIDMKKNVDAALEKSSVKVNNVLVVHHVEEEKVEWDAGRDIWYHEIINGSDIADFCEPEHMDAEDPLFILYTSGSTGKPKGVLHTTGGYLLGAAVTHYYVFDHKPEDIYWCTADIGWITGHSYILYGPLANGATSVMFEGVPTYPNPGRFWEVVDKHKVDVFYTAPTAIRALAKEGNEWVEKHSLKTLRLLGTVGEPINPEAWEWYYRIVGKERCPVVDTYWQTETGAHMITPIPGATSQKPGSATLPFLGVKPVIVDNEGNLIEGNDVSGNLCISSPWPSMMRGVYGDPERFKMTYFSHFKGYYFTGDGAMRDKDGYYWITGRVDDVLNVSGHRIGSAEVESALVEHEAVAEAAVVAFPHDIKGQGIYAYVILNSGYQVTDNLQKELIDIVASGIGKIARPDVIHFAPGLPKTRSGKIMRRILRKIAEGVFDNLGDVTTLADPGVVKELIDERKKH